MLLLDPEQVLLLLDDLQDFEDELIGTMLHPSILEMTTMVCPADQLITMFVEPPLPEVDRGPDVNHP